MLSFADTTGSVIEVRNWGGVMFRGIGIGGRTVEGLDFPDRGRREDDDSGFR